MQDRLNREYWRVQQHMGRVYGYIRVSSREQNEDRQRLALASFDIPPKQLYIDRQSGKDFERPAYQRLKKN